MAALFGGATITRWAQLICVGAIPDGPGRIAWSITPEVIRLLAANFDTKQPIPVVEAFGTQGQRDARGEPYRGVDAWGWVTAVRVAMGELWGRVEFTPAGWEEAQKFTHFSPGIMISRRGIREADSGPRLLSVAMARAGEAYPFAGDMSLMVGGV